MTTALSDIQNALCQRMRPRVIDQYNRSDVKLNALRKTAGRGKNVSADATFGSTTLQTFTDGQVVSTFNKDTDVPWSLSWVELGDALKITGRAEDAAQGDDTELGALFVRKLMERKTSIAGGINVELYTGAGGASILGTQTAAGPLDSTGTFAGINRATYPQWAGNVLANGGIPRGLSMKLLEQAFEAVDASKGGGLTMGFASSSMFNRLAAMAGDKVRVLQEAYIRGEALKASLGFQAVEVFGVPIFKDTSSPAGTIELINDRHIGIEYLPAAPSRMARGKVIQMVPIAGTPQEQLNALVPGGVPAIGEASALMACLINLPFAGNAEAWQLVTTCTLWCDRPNAHVLIKDIDTN